MIREWCGGYYSGKRDNDGGGGEKVLRKAKSWKTKRWSPNVTHTRWSGTRWCPGRGCISSFRDTEVYRSFRRYSRWLGRVMITDRLWSRHGEEGEGEKEVVNVHGRNGIMVVYLGVWSGVFSVYYNG